MRPDGRTEMDNLNQFVHYFFLAPKEQYLAKLDTKINDLQTQIERVKKFQKQFDQDVLILDAEVIANKLGDNP